MQCIWLLTRRGLNSHSPSGGVYGHYCRLRHITVCCDLCLACLKRRERNNKPLRMHPHAVHNREERCLG